MASQRPPNESWDALSAWGVSDFSGSTTTTSGSEGRLLRDEADPPSISDYAIIGDCRTAALVSRYGSIDWLCLPNFSGASVFAAILDAEKGGSFCICPADRSSGRRRYLPGTPVLETTFSADDGSFRILDLMPIDRGIPDALTPDREVLRVVEGISGSPTIHVKFQPRPDYGRAEPRFAHRGKWCWLFAERHYAYLLTADVALGVDEDGKGLFGVFRLSPGERWRFSMSYANANPVVIPGLGKAADRRLSKTIAWWEEWSGRCTYTGPYRDQVVRSVLTLKLLTYVLSGALVAAPTSSLPEWLGGTRNWDYRYCWLRDASFTVAAFVELGYHREATAFVDWLIYTTRLTWPRLQVMYNVYGETNLREFKLSHLSGYRGSAPVRIGNGASSQRQLDVYGHVIIAAYDFVAAGGILDNTEKRLLLGFGDTICKVWREPDNGIWEYRGPGRQNTYSKMMCWAGLDRLIRLDDDGVLRTGARLDGFRRIRDEIRGEIETNGYNAEIDSYVSVFGGRELDATLLLMARCGYTQPEAPRMTGTFARMEKDLEREGLLYRYPIGFDGIDEPEGAFVVCSFWAVEYLARLGQPAKARERFEALLSHANDVGLLSEEIDSESGAMLGNFPQAFSHSGLINAALAIARAEAG